MATTTLARRASLLLFASALSAGMVSCSTPSKVVCRNRIEFTDPKDIKFDSNEKIFLCGDGDKASWKEIPYAQAEHDIRNFLTGRAYYEPKITFTDEKLIVDPGEKRVVKELKFEGVPEHFLDVRIRKVINEPFTSQLLDTVENWTTLRLKNMGYACPTVKARGIIDKNLLVVHVDPGNRFEFTEPKLRDSIGLYPHVFERFNAFVPAAPYRYEWVQLSQNRAEQDGIVVSSQIRNVCPQVGPPLAMTQEVLGGDPRLVTIGAGASTEEFPILELTWKSVRMNEAGSELSITLHGSQRIQRVNSEYALYAFKNTPRLSVNPTFIFEHDKESTFTSTTFQIAAPLTYKGDTENVGYKLAMGPGMDRVYSQEALNSKAVTFSSIVAQADFNSHDYELYAADPRSGFGSQLNAEFLTRGFGFDPRAAVLRLKGTNLFQLNAVYPAQWILGVRYQLGSTITKETPGPNTFLPARYFNRLGGDENLRGFSRQEITGNTLGSLMSAYIGAEVRYAKTLMLGLEPFLFFDAGWLGQNIMQFDRTLYYSPGLGIRWQTPFGAIRSTIAHGYVSPRPANTNLEHLQFFISFGKEF